MRLTKKKNQDKKIKPIETESLQNFKLCRLRQMKNIYEFKFFNGLVFFIFPFFPLLKG